MADRIMGRFVARQPVSYLVHLLTLVLVELGTVVLVSQTGDLMDEFTSAINQSVPQFTQKLVFIMLILVGLLLAKFLHKAIDFRLSNQGLIYVESQVLDHLMHVDLEEVLPKNKIKLAQQINNDTVVIADYWVAQLPNMVIKALKLILVLIICAYQSIYAAALLVAVFLLYVFIFKISQSHYKKANLAMINAQQDYFGVLGGELLNVFLVKANSWYRRTIEQFERSGKTFVAKSLKFLNLDFFLSNILSIFTSALTIIVPLILLVRQKATLANIFILITLIQIYFSDLQIVIELFKARSRKDVATQRMDDLLALPREPNGDLTVERIDSVATKQLSFQYRDTSHLILDKFTCSFPMNAITAIVGENGSGKSTLLKLLLGLLRPTAGEVSVNAIDLPKLDMVQLRKEQISFCEQEPYLLHDTILNNLNYGLDKPKDLAYYQANPLLDFVADLEAGFDTLISPRSENLSGGQKQKIALARSLGKDEASLLIFDEPTSALDKASAQAFMAILQEKKENCTILIVSHDPLVQGMADEVLSLEA